VPSLDDLAEDLAAGIARGDITAAFQPQISVQTGAVVAFEALGRWTHPRWGVISPDRFISAAEHTGDIHDLGGFMLTACLDAVEKWRTHGIGVSVNVSPLQLASASFPARVAAELSSRSLPGSALTIEITESLPVIDRNSLIPRLRELRDLGIGISLDDFGKENATLEHIESLPLTEVKLDGAMIQEAEGEMTEALTEVVYLARERSLRIVAEGIETRDHLATAAALRCDRAQGYMIGLPRPLAEIELPAR
jgi:EAL domain-containing protein (putative c-di-GMP-specific phosphodiesterase class I)